MPKIAYKYHQNKAPQKPKWSLGCIEHQVVGTETKKPPKWFFGNPKNPRKELIY